MKKSTYLFAIALGVSTISLAQNVGINTDGSDPDTDALLHLLNTNSTALDPLIRLENQQNASVNGIELLNSGGATAAEWDLYIPSTKTDFRVSNGTTDHVTIQNDGDVGIGTINPTVKLHVKGGEGNDYQLLMENEQYEKGINFYFKSPSGGAWDFPQATIWTSGVWGTYDTQLNFSTANGTNNADTELFTALTIDDTQRIGIGTTSPSSLLTINNTANYADPTIDFQVAGITKFSMGIDDSDADKFKIGTSDITTNTRMTIDAAGYVGIGTDEPTVPLQIKGGGTTAGDYQFFIENESYNKGIQFQYKSAAGATYDFPQAKIWTSGVAFDTKLNFSTANGTNNGDTELYTALTIDGTQRIGIGNSAPSVELDVTGDIEYTGTITDVSDRRLKENFSSIDSVLTKIMKIDGLSYNMINDSLKIREYGVIAQDVQAVFPEMVTTVDPENGYLGVAYIQLIPVLLEGMKEQQAIIEAQKKEIESQKAENAAQEKEVEEVKAELDSKTSDNASASTANASEIEALKAQVQQLLQLIQQQESASVK